MDYSSSPSLLCNRHVTMQPQLIMDYSSSLDRHPDTLEDLKYILNMIAEIGARSMVIELRYSALEEKYRTLRMYGYAVPQEEADLIDPSELS